MLGGAERLGRVPSGHRQALGHGSTSLETAEWRGPRAYGWGRPGPPGSVFASAAVLRAASHRMPALGRGPRACAGGRAPADAHRAVGDADAVALWPRAGLVCGAVCHRCPLRWAGHPTPSVREPRLTSLPDTPLLGCAGPGEAVHGRPDCGRGLPASLLKPAPSQWDQGPSESAGSRPVRTPAASCHMDVPFAEAHSECSGFKVRGHGRQDAQTTSQPSSSGCFPRPV